MTDTKNVTYYKCPCGHPSCNQFILSTQGNVGFSKSDAQLYTAAPDMLDALERIEKWFDTDVEILDAMSPDERADHERQHQMIRDSIAKARGDAS